jgi:forkhead protein FKH
MKWRIVPEAKDEMVDAAWRVGRGGHRGSSAPSSPNQLNYITQGPRDMASRGTPVKRKRRSSLLVSPPQDHSALQSTPDRRVTTRNAASTFDGSPLPRTKKKSTTSTDPLSSFQPQSPTLTSSYYEAEGASFVTPAPPRVHPKLAPPSTAQRPSQHMPTSSPAPFWRFADIGSTPLKPYRAYEASPSKTASNAPPAASSSPAPLNKSPGSSPRQPQPQKQAANQAVLPVPDEEETFDLTK